MLHNFSDISSSPEIKPFYLLQHLPTREGTFNGAPMEVGDEGEEDLHLSDDRSNQDNGDWDQISFEGDGEEAPGHAYENIGPLNSPPPGFTMPPKPRWDKCR